MVLPGGPLGANINRQMALFYQQPGLEYPEHPPAIEIPGVGVYEQSESSNPIDRSQSVDSKSSKAHYMGETFPILCRFWQIMHPVALRYYNHIRLPSETLRCHVNLEFAEYKFRELIAWMETLPASLVQTEKSAHHIVILQSVSLLFRQASYS